MEYVLSALLLHKLGKEINEANLKKVLESAGVKPDEAKVKALVAALEGVNIEEAIKQSAVMPAPVAAQASEQTKKEEKKEEKKPEVDASAGLGALFG
ncbi:50S ribosomal protein P1 [archaeon]|nr:50S ribosomal protein P1 [archaeon]